MNSCMSGVWSARSDGDPLGQAGGREEQLVVTNWPHPQPGCYGPMWGRGGEGWLIGAQKGWLAAAVHVVPVIWLLGFYIDMTVNFCLPIGELETVKKA